MLGYVAVPMPNGAAPLRLSTREVAENHVRDWELLAKLELALMQYNTRFFFEGRSSDFLKALADKLHPFLSAILTNIIGSIIANDKATLHELRTVYSLEDAWLLWEVIAVARYNEYLAADYRRKQMAQR